MLNMRLYIDIFALLRGVYADFYAVTPCSLAQYRRLFLTGISYVYKDLIGASGAKRRFLYLSWYGMHMISVHAL